MFVSDTGEPYCREERHHDADAQREGKATDGSRSEVIKNDGRDDRREVGVEDGREGIAVTVGQSRLDVLAGAQFLLGAFVDKHVGVDSHTERKHHTGNTAHGESRLEGGEDAQREEEVEQKGDVGYHTCAEAVEAAHENHEQDEGYHAGGETGLDGGFAERGTYGFGLHRHEGHAHLTAVEHDGQGAGVVGRETA